jgi:hypothetical protein
LRFHIENDLEKTEYESMREFLRETKGASIELFPGIDLEFISVNALRVAAEDFGFRIDTEILFKQPIGFEAYEELKLGDETRSFLAVNRRNFELSKMIAEQDDLEEELNTILNIVERIVNHVCNRFDKLVEQTFKLDSEWLDRRLERIDRKEELRKRGEVPSPFGRIHAKDAGDAKERAGDLVPIYIERDKSYLYEDKKVYMLLPRNFVMKLLSIDGPAMIAADQFTDEEREVLDKFSMRKYIETTRIGGKTHYFNLDETTRKILLKSMRKR